MAVFFLPEFVADMQSHKDAHFARRVLQKTLLPDGTFRPDSDDHRYEGIQDAWVRYVSRRRTSYRVIYIRLGENVYLYRAGEHHVENRLTKPRRTSMVSALPVHKNEEENVVTFVTEHVCSKNHAGTRLPDYRFRRNTPQPQIYQEIFSRRNLPHKDIWLVAPFINEDLFLPTADFGRLLLDQVEDGASVVIVTSPPGTRSIEWMERLAERGVDIYVYPRLHTKLYCFLFDKNRRYEPGLRGGDQYSSLILLGSANLTRAGIAIGDDDNSNEELCYIVPAENVGYVESYIIELMENGYELPDVRRYLASGQGQVLERRKW